MIQLTKTGFAYHSSLVGVVGYHDRLTRGRSPVRTWYETLCGGLAQW